MAQALSCQLRSKVAARRAIFEFVENQDVRFEQLNRPIEVGGNRPLARAMSQIPGRHPQLGTRRPRQFRHVDPRFTELPHY